MLNSGEFYSIRLNLNDFCDKRLNIGAMFCLNSRCAAKKSSSLMSTFTKQAELGSILLPFAENFA